jgi:hypothetical protein
MKSLSRSLWSASAICALTALSFALPGCGDGAASQETVYLHVFNAYPGSSQMSLYGPSGRIVTGLPYSGRTAQPVAVNRNMGTTFTLVIDGAPQSIELDFALFDLYPQETGTLLIRRRSSTDMASAHIYRHQQSISRQCRLVIDNALSVDTSDITRYGFMAAFRYDNIGSAGYTSDDPRGSSFLNTVAQNPYFFLVEHPEIPQGLMPVWPVQTPDRIGHADYDSGAVLAHPTTREVLECLGEEEYDAATFEDCTRPQTYAGTAYLPDVPTINVIEVGANNSGQCNLSFRIYSDFSNIFQGEHGIGNGSYVEDEVTIDSSDHMFWVLYGRPVNPLIRKWYAADPSSGETAGGGFVQVPNDSPGQ